MTLSLRGCALTLSLFLLASGPARFDLLPRAQAQGADASVRSAGEREASAADARRAQVLVKGDGFSITVGTLEDHINKQPPGMRTRYSDTDERKALLDSLVRLELLGREALARGMSESRSVRQTVKDGAVQALVRSEIDEKVSAESISTEDIAAFYNTHPDEFHHAAERRASHIATDTREHAVSLIAEAKKTDMRGFAELARKHSLDTETKLRGGDLSFFTRESPRDTSLRKVPDALRSAVFALKAPGDIADEPVAVESQFSVVRLTGERPERHVSLGEAESSIRARLWRERRQQALTHLIDGLRAQQKPQVFADRVDLVKFDDMERRPGGFKPDPLRPVGGSKKSKAPK
jgi:parvulin-like peptidyl-prolyl isomerase